MNNLLFYALTLDVGAAVIWVPIVAFCIFILWISWHGYQSEKQEDCKRVIDKQSKEIKSLREELEKKSSKNELSQTVDAQAEEIEQLKISAENARSNQAALLSENSSLKNKIHNLEENLNQKTQDITKLKAEIEYLSHLTEHSGKLNEPEEVSRELKLDDLDDEQHRAYDLMHNTNQNLFITGKAGTGKSALLKVFDCETEKSILKLAPTGIAAINIGGVTIHSAFGFNNLVKLNYDEITHKTLKLSGDKRIVLQGAKTIVIDEISMVRADILEKIDRILKIICNSSKPFGGKQMIFFGDLFQLPPIAKKDVRLYLNDKFGGIHFFNSMAYKQGNFTFIELTVNHRQQGDDAFFEILNNIREGTVTDEQLELLNSRTHYDSTELISVPRLFSKKDMVQYYNESRMEESPGRAYRSIARVIYPENGRYPIMGEDEKGREIKFDFEANFPVSQELRIKKGVLVMFVKNNGDKYANGTLGIVTEIYDGRILVAVNKEVIEVTPTQFECLEARYKNDKIVYEVVCRIEQYPIILAYAMTIHKAQGQTYGRMACDISECFAPGQAYVALSRVKKISGLYLLSKIYRSQIQVDTAVNEFYNENKRRELPFIFDDDDSDIDTTQYGLIELPEETD